MKTDNAEARLRARMDALLEEGEHRVLAAAVGIVKDGRILFSEVRGVKRPGGGPAGSRTKYRIASISKLITAVGVWQLIERGLIDPDADVSGYVGFPLRNPAYPEIPITVKMLLSHTSSIRDGSPGVYNIPLGHHISEYFAPGSPCYNPRCWAPAGEAPRDSFSSCNMNYCLLGSVIENVSGERFDRYMADHVFTPLALSCSYNVSDMPDGVRAEVAPLYRRLNGSGEADPAGVWTVQQDDFSGSFQPEDYAGYVIGTNGSLFGPMGSLRISMDELCRMTLLFCHGGSLDGVQILKPETLERMFAPAWTYDPAEKNGDNYGGLMNCYGMGPHIFTNQDMGDRMVAGRDLPFAGHTAEAYGLIGGMGFDRKKGNGIVYFVSGLGGDMAKCPGKHSMFYRLEEDLLAAAAEFADFGE